MSQIFVPLEIVQLGGVAGRVFLAPETITAVIEAGTEIFYDEDGNGGMAEVYVTEVRTYRDSYRVKGNCEKVAFEIAEALREREAAISSALQHGPQAPGAIVSLYAPRAPDFPSTDDPADPPPAAA